MQESNVTKIDFGNDNQKVINESEEYIDKKEDGYYVEIIQSNGTKQTLTSNDKSYKGCKEIYSFVKEELCEKIKSVTLLKYENGIRKDNYTKTFKTDSQPYNVEEFLALITETAEQISKMKKYIAGISTYQSMSDKMLDVMYHAIECRDYHNDEEMIMDFTAIKATLSRRREIKNLMYIANYIMSNKNLFDINRFNEEHQQKMMATIRKELNKRRDKGIKKCVTTNDKIKVIHYSDDKERMEAFSKLKKQYNCVKDDEYQGFLAGYNLIYRK